MDEFRIRFQQSWGGYLNLDELAELTGTHPELLLRFIEFGLIEVAEQEGAELNFELSAIEKVRTIRRLRSEMGVNLAGVAVILKLLDKIRQLQAEIEWLR